MTSLEIIDPCARLLQYPEILRARNARLILSNVVPEGLEIPEALSYCLWNTDFAEEDTYRQVVQRYPAMRDQLIPEHQLFLNGDTHVHWKLEWRYTIEEDAIVEFAPEEIDIEEDRYMGLEADEPDQTLYDEPTPQEAVLLWDPLPLDLPTAKDLLRQMAAYEGYVDRYANLLNWRSEKKIVPLEALCVIRGIITTQYLVGG
ncbi:hypothetical protein BDW67DRAFT_188259 [Aspergillus spinulosporus]